MPLIIAHRTCPLDAPENSLEGIRRAAELGADGVEIDLRVALDLQPFLMHDHTMRRTTGFPLPLELTPSAVVRRLRLRGSEERVPSLASAVDVLPEGLLLAVDVKTPWAVAPLLKAVDERGLGSRVLVWCESALACRYVASHRPEIELAYLKTALTATAKQRFLEKACRIGAKAISAHWLAIDAEFVAAAHAKGLRVSSWHGRYTLEPSKLTSGLDILITDTPREAREAFEALAGAGTPSP